MISSWSGLGFGGPLHPSTEGAAILNPQGLEVVMTEDCSVGLGTVRKSWC